MGVTNGSNGMSNAIGMRKKCSVSKYEGDVQCVVHEVAGQSWPSQPPLSNAASSASYGFAGSTALPTASSHESSRAIRWRAWGE